MTSWLGIMPPDARASLPSGNLPIAAPAQIEWRKKYRKYKPLRQPATCNGCHKKTVTAAYHKLCADCAKERRVCPFCCTGGRPRAGGEKGDDGDEGEANMDIGAEGEGTGRPEGRGGAEGRREASMAVSDEELEEEGMWELDGMDDLERFDSGSRRSGGEQRQKR